MRVSAADAWQGLCGAARRHVNRTVPIRAPSSRRFSTAERRHQAREARQPDRRSARTASTTGPVVRRPRQRVTRARPVNPAGSPHAPTSLARGDRPARACRLPRHRRTPRRESEQEITMNLETLIAQWSGQLPPGFVPPAVMRGEPPQCCQPRCRRPCAVKANQEWAASCQPCLDRRAASCRRRRAALVATGGCRRCAYRRRLEGDFLCARCREDRDIERAQKRQDAIDAAAIDDFAARPETAHRASNLDIGISPWNARPKPEASAAYWSPLPDPEPREEREWARPLFDDGWRYRRC